MRSLNLTILITGMALVYSLLGQTGFHIRLMAMDL